MFEVFKSEAYPKGSGGEEYPKGSGADSGIQRGQVSKGVKVSKGVRSRFRLVGTCRTSSGAADVVVNGVKVGQGIGIELDSGHR
jgi:hypothetical protein